MTQTLQCALFGGLSCGVMNRTKTIDWKKVTEAINSVSSRIGTLADLESQIETLLSESCAIFFTL